MGAVVIGMDPHKRSATIEVMAGDETVLGGGRYATDVEGYRAMLRYARLFTERTWAIEGCNGIGRHIAMRLLADGEEVVDVPPKGAACFCGRIASATGAINVPAPPGSWPRTRRKIARERTGTGNLPAPPGS
jgi:hypothetical protein